VSVPDGSVPVLLFAIPRRFFFVFVFVFVFVFGAPRLVSVALEAFELRAQRVRLEAPLEERAAERGVDGRDRVRLVAVGGLSSQNALRAEDEREKRAEPRRRLGGDARGGGGGERDALGGHYRRIHRGLIQADARRALAPPRVRAQLRDAHARGLRGGPHVAKQRPVRLRRRGVDLLGDPPRGGGVELVRQEPLEHEVDVPDRQQGHEPVLQGNHTERFRRSGGRRVARIRARLQSSSRRVRLVFFPRAAREQRRGLGEAPPRAAPGGGGGGDALAHSVVRGGERGGVRGDVSELARARRQQGHARHRHVRRDDFVSRRDARRRRLVVPDVRSRRRRDSEPDEHAREVRRRRRVLHDDTVRRGRVFSFRVVLRGDVRDGDSALAVPRVSSRQQVFPYPRAARGCQVRAPQGYDPERGQRDGPARVAADQHGESVRRVEVIHQRRAKGVRSARLGAPRGGGGAAALLRAAPPRREREPRGGALVRERRARRVRRGRDLPVQAGHRARVRLADVQRLAVLDVVKHHGAVGVAGDEHLAVRTPPERRHGRVRVGAPQLVLALAALLVPLKPG